MHFKSLDIGVEEKKKESSYFKIGNAVIAYMLSYLDARNIFSIIPLIDRRNQQLIKSLSLNKIFWQSLYTGPFNTKNSKESYQEKTFNKQSSVLYSAISAGATDFLLEECREWNLNIILSIFPPSNKKKFILLELLYQSQLLSIIDYLKNSRAKRQLLDEKFKSKFLELKEEKFEYLQLPDDELQSLIHWTEEKNQKELKRRCEGFSTILNNLKRVVANELSHAESRFVPEKLNYLKLYFKILFWNKDDDADPAEPSFQKMLFESRPSFTLNLIREKSHYGPFFDAYLPGTLNGLLMGVNVGNLHFLEACSDSIRSCSFLTYSLNSSQNPTLLNFLQRLLLEAIRNKQESVTQFLLERIIQPKQKSSKELFFQPIICRAFCRNYYYLAMLVIAHAGGISTQSVDQGSLLESTHQVQYEDLISPIILSTTNIDMNATANKTTLLERISYNAYLYLKLNKEEYKKLPNQLEKIRLLLLLGADPKKFSRNTSEINTLKARATINYILKCSLQSAHTEEIEEMKSVGSLYLSTETYIPHLKKINFLKFEQKASSPMQSKIASHYR